jgi:outer membrane protein OmpA-like peptidoglycan-associated protein
VKISNRLPIVAAIMGMTSACGSTAPTPQLVDARAAMNEARASEASELTPDKLLTAKQALDRAEKAHEDDAGSDKEAHLAYLASRKAHIAMAHGKIAAAKETQSQAEDTYQSRLENVARSSSNQLDTTHAALEAERQRRAEAEKRASAALASLQQVANVRADNRGTVITLPGGVLFPSGGSNLSPTARVALDQVANALTEQPIESKIVIEGHTDDRGSDANNQQLSQARADAVRSFLLEKGLVADRVQAIGKGESEPIASNDSAEGRATNRRVDLVVSDTKSASSPQASTTSSAQPGNTAPSAQPSR